MNFETYLQEHDGKRLKAAKTVSSYVREVELFAAWLQERHGETLTPAALTATDVAAWLSEQQAARLEPSTLQRRKMSIQAYGRYAVHIRAIAENPVERIPNFEQVELCPRWLKPEQVRALQKRLELQYNGAPSGYAKQLAARDLALFALMRHAGLRVDEVCNLDPLDIELGDDRGIVTIRHGKGGKKRTVPLNRQAREAVINWLQVRPAVAGPWLFVGKRGERLGVSGVERRFRELGEELGFELTPHMLRHTFAKALLLAGKPLHYIQQLMGHKNRKVTERYTLPDVDELAEAVEATEPATMPTMPARRHAPRRADKVLVHQR